MIAFAVVYGCLLVAWVLLARAERDTTKPPAPDKLEPRSSFNPGLDAARKYHMEGSESEIAERIARGNW